jgi:glucosamine 6-phosphate synthetase-like amidotransferase/phosphosugar isomerase protein
VLQVVMEVVSQLEGAFALLIRSTRFPDELMAAKKGSPLLVGECPFDCHIISFCCKLRCSSV